MKNKLWGRQVAKVFAGIFFVIPGILKAQSVDELRKQYPDEKAVFLNKTIEYTITLKNGQPNVESHEIQQITYLSSIAATFMGQFSFSHSSFKKVLKYQAYTQTPDKKKLKVTDFKTTTSTESSVFYDDFKTTAFNFPGVEQGATGSLDVSYQDTDPHMLTPFYFSSWIPVINSALKLTVAKNINVRYRLLGADTSHIVVNVENSHGNKVYTFMYKNCPDDKRYADAPSFQWYEPHVVFYIDSYKDGDKPVSYLSNAADLYRLSYGYIKNINNTVGPELKHVVDSLTSSLPQPEAKARAIYHWVQQNIKYVAFEDGMEGLVPRDAGLVCSRRFGDCKDMASILTEMLNATGIPAYFVWIGTRDLPYKFSDLPLPLVSNHMICAAKLNDKFVFLDGTDPTCIFGRPSAGIQDKEAMIAINDNDYKIVTVPAVEKSANLLTDTTWLELTDKGLKGRIKENLDGYFATDMYGKLMYTNNKSIHDEMKDEFSRGSNTFQLDTFAVERQPTTDKITLLANFTLPNYAKKIAGDYYLNLNLFKFYVDDQIDYPKRTMPIKFEFKFVKKYVTMLKVPDGYKVSYLPQGKSFHNNIWGFDLEYQQKGNYIIFTQQFDNNDLILTTDKFQSWNKVLEYLYPLYKESISLSKI